MMFSAVHTHTQSKMINRFLAQLQPPLQTASEDTKKEEFLLMVHRED